MTFQYKNPDGATWQPGAGGYVDSSGKVVSTTPIYSNSPAPAPTAPKTTTTPNTNTSTKTQQAVDQYNNHMANVGTPSSGGSSGGSTSTVNLANEKKYLEGLLADAQKSGNTGLATWANNQAKKLGITLGAPTSGGAINTGNGAINTGGGAIGGGNQFTGYSEQDVQKMINDALKGIEQPTRQLDPRIEGLLGKIESYIGKGPSSISDIMGGGMYKQLEAAIKGQSEQSMMGAKAQLAAAGVLGEGSTPAAEKFAQVGAREGLAIAGLIPQLMQAEQGAYNSGLGNLLTQLNAISGEHGRTFNESMTEFQNYMPYLTPTIQQIISNLLTESQIRGEFVGPGGSDGSSGSSGAGELVSDVRGYVTQKGGTVSHGVVNGRHVVYVNGKAIDVLAVGGKVENGKSYIPKSYLDAALGVN